jgi:hypothetical protein
MKSICLPACPLVYPSICPSFERLQSVDDFGQGVVKVLPDADSLNTLAASTVASGTCAGFCLVNKGFKKN